MIKQKDHNLILDEFFLNLLKFSHKYKLDGIFGIIIYQNI